MEEEELAEAPTEREREGAILAAAVEGKGEKVPPSLLPFQGGGEVKKRSHRFLSRPQHSVGKDRVRLFWGRVAGTFLLAAKGKQKRAFLLTSAASAPTPRFFLFLA